MASVAKSAAAPTGPQLDNRRIAAAAIDLAVPALVFVLAAAAGYLTLGVAVVLVGWTLYYFGTISVNGQTNACTAVIAPTMHATKMLCQMTALKMSASVWHGKDPEIEDPRDVLV